MVFLLLKGKVLNGSTTSGVLNRVLNIVKNLQEMNPDIIDSFD